VEPTEEVAGALAGDGWWASRALFPQEMAVALAEDARRLAADGRFRPARVGRGDGRHVRDDVRRDLILWLDRLAPSPPQALYWARIEELRRALNRLLFLGLEEFEGHLAVFPPGGFYRRHLDRFSDADERSISVVLFLNPGWRAADGGALRLHLAQGSRDVPPELGTAVVFRSDLVWHEVLPASAPRFSATGWFRRRPVG